MQAESNQPPPDEENASRIRLLFLLVAFLSVCFLSTGSAKSVSGSVSQIGSSPTRGQDSADGIWRIVDKTSLRPRVESASPRAYQVVELHEDALSQALANVPMEFSDDAKTVQVAISLPMPEGKFARFRIEESPVMEPELAAQFPEVKSYRGQGIDDPTATARFDWSPDGVHGIVLSANGNVFISHYSADDHKNFISFFKDDLLDGFQPPQCEVTEQMQASAALRRGLERQFAAEGFAQSAFVGTTLRTYRLALATTVEYTNNPTYGGNKASTLIKLNTIVNLINAMYEREVSIRFQLVSSELSIIFDTEPDGYTNSSASTMLNENPTVLNATIGSGAYDIGHVFGFSSAGSSSGIAQIGVVCGASKGKGASVLGIALTTGNFSIDSGLVAHEWGHQFSATHTFNSISGVCGNPGQRNASTAFEPGSGSTLMAYPGICAPENLQPNSDTYFLGGSFDQIASYSAGSGASCAMVTPTGNNPPTVSAGPDFTIPMGTPFTLTASGSDPDGDALTYSWEELDIGTASPPMTDDGTRPLFRSFPAVTSPSRTLPKLADILNNTSTIGETMPTTTRPMNFRVTARDNRGAGGGVNSDAMILNVTSASGPFTVAQPNTPVTWVGGTSRTVTWNAANTSSPPVNCANVKISFSTDGGFTFPFVLAASTPNDGTETVVIPNTSTTAARIKVEAVGNIFFDISNTSFTVTQSAYGGFHDGAGCDTISGWAWDANNPNGTVSVDIFDGTALIGTVPANMYREDLLNALGSPSHGFSFLTPAALKNGAVHTISVKFSGTNTLLTNSPRTIQCGLPSNLQGRHDGQGCNAIEGWAWNSNDPNGTVNVDIYDGTTLIGTVAATLYRQDLADALGSPYHGFIFHTPASLKDGQPHTVTVKFGGTNTNLTLDTPRTTSCTSTSPNYQGNHDVADCNFISGFAWDTNDDQGTINAAIYVDGAFFVVVPAQEAYPGIGTGYHGFKFAVPASLKNTQPHSIQVKFSGTNVSLSNSPRIITCPP